MRLVWNISWGLGAYAREFPLAEHFANAARALEQTSSTC